MRNPTNLDVDPISGDEIAQPDAKLLIVDDDEAILSLLGRMLEHQGMQCTFAMSPAEGMAKLEEQPFDLLLSDVNMPPGRSGLEFVRDARQRYPEMAAIMLSGEDDPQVGRVAVEVGAFGYLIKPFTRNEVIINVNNAMHRRGLMLENRAHSQTLQRAVVERTTELLDTIERLEEAEKELRLSHRETIERLTRAAEYRDDDTGQHLQRMSRYSQLLARLAGMSEEDCQLIRSASPMHDIGKVGIPDGILLKPGKLSPAEYDVMKKHPEIGYKILAGSQSPLLQIAAGIAYSHHEKYDGSGYPRNLKGGDIRFEGRIVAIADVFDALTTERVYKPAQPLHQAMDFMMDHRGKHFDPDLLNLFFSAMDQVVAIKERFSDASTTP